jgi:hypothetical protein
MKRFAMYLFVLLIITGASAILYATEKIQQKHLIMVDTMTGGCAFCHNPVTGIEQKKADYRKGKKNYYKISTFSSSGCSVCHTKTGFTPRGIQVKEESGF